jgi:hypothetical protein
LFQDHRDGNLEAVGMTMACCLHKAVSSRFQVTIPVRNIWDRGTVVRDRIRAQAWSQGEDGNAYLLPTPPKPCAARVQPGSER